MTDSATSRLKLRQQSQGSNINTWGDDKLNEVLRVIDRAMHGVQSLAITGDTTLSWTNYVATNDGQVAWLTLTGSLSSAASLTVPSVEWAWKGIKNSTGQTITVKTAAGAGVAIPNGRQIAVYSDATDCYFGGGNYLGSDITEANVRDIVDKDYVDTAVATLGSGSIGVGSLLIDGGDGTAGFLAAKLLATSAGGVSLTSAGTTNKTYSAALDVNGMTTTTNVAATDAFAVYDATAAAMKKQTRALVVGKIGLILQGSSSTVNPAVAGNLYPVDCTSGAGSFTGPASATLGDVIGVMKFGLFDMTFNPNSLNYYGSTSSALVSDEGLTVLIYSGATRGWIDV